jgi:hypothetical protein
MAVAIAAGLAHDRNDLINRRRIGGVALALVISEILLGRLCSLTA